MIHGNKTRMTTYVVRDSCNNNANVPFFTPPQVYGMSDVPLPESAVSWVALQPGSPSKFFWNTGDSPQHFLGGGLVRLCRQTERF
jgi:hypothetical protein